MKKNLNLFVKGEVGVLNGKRFIVLDRWPCDRSSGGTVVWLEDDCETKTFYDEKVEDQRRKVECLGAGELKICLRPRVKAP